MKYTKAQFKKDQASLLATFETLTVNLRYEGKTLTGILWDKTIEAKATLFGFGFDYDFIIRVDIGSLKKLDPELSIIEIKLDGERAYSKYRVVSIQDKIGTSYLISVQAEYV